MHAPRTAGYSEPILEVRGLERTYRRGAIEVPVLKDLDLEVHEGAWVACTGRSGSGKSTLLHVLGLLDSADAGAYSLAGHNVAVLDDTERAQLRNELIGFVFQLHNLLPRTTALENVATPLIYRGVRRAERLRAAAKALEAVGLAHRSEHDPSELSGGQMQRVAIARAIVNKPQVLLLDEPLGALDLKMRKEMQIELKEMQRSLGITFVYVTHDQEEALTMSDTIIVMKEGLIQQIGTPTDIYNEPRNAFVADFIGESNIIPGQMTEDFVVSFAQRSFDCIDRRMPEDEVDVVIRPEDIVLTGPNDRTINGRVVSVVFKGVHYEMLVEAGPFTWMIQSTDFFPTDASVGLTFDPEDIHIMAKSTYSPDRQSAQPETESEPDDRNGGDSW
mgnify:CR=1 FL=1